MRFLQFYFGLPIAMIILSLTVVPFFHRARVYTAYEYLERRFDCEDAHPDQPALPALARAVLRDVIFAAPAVILSVVLGWNVTVTVFAHRPAHGALHDGRRRAGGHLDRCEADVS